MSTGANAGAGYKETKILLSKGAAVVMLNRIAPKSETTFAQLKKDEGADADVRSILMDLADLTSVRRVVEKVLGVLPQIDAFIESRQLYR
ncbi:SDR family NAD(P)-dependent oxidoreductase [Ruegeria arenilitoris]|uniref:SDR family NAD(P)-dependent oxidoreductase n=1 Tax=Ruegeria arenilitoris TaxID=1173585 RepID=UPI00346394DD